MTPKVRKKIEDYILSFVNKVDISGINGKMYAEIFPKLTDKQLMSMIQDCIPIYMPNDSKVDIDAYRNIAIGKEMGYQFYQRCWITDPVTGACHLTQVPHIILTLPCRRQTQMIDKKVSIPVHSRTIDKTTGQVTGSDSKGSSFSFPQTYVMAAKGYTETLKELLQVRGGNLKANRIVEQQIRETGQAVINFEGFEHTRVKSSVVLGAIYNAQHLGNTLLSLR